MTMILFLFPSYAFTQSQESFPIYAEEMKVKITGREKALNFGAVYLSQWAFYFYSQEDVIRKYGSLKNWYRYPFNSHFDKDGLEFNIIKHSFVGSYYYLFYRSRGYTLDQSFIWSFLSSLAFEFTIETVTERPSFQDIYQTPVFGIVLGIGMEKASTYFHSFDTWYANVLGYIFNPMTLIPQFARDDEKLRVSTFLHGDAYGAVLTYRF